MTREEAFKQLYELNNYPLEFQEGLFPLFERIYINLSFKMQENHKEAYVLDPQEVLCYLFEEFFYNVKMASKEQALLALKDPQFCDRIVTLLADKIYINEFLGFENKSLLNDYSPLITTFDFVLNFIFDRFSKFASNQDINNSIFLDILRKGFMMSKGVLTLLVNGLETEAFSTWRTIHEVECIAKILNDKPYLTPYYIKHIDYARYYRNDNSNLEKQQEIFSKIKEEMKELNLKSKDMKKYIEYGWLTNVENVLDDYPEFKLNFRKGVELIAGLSSYSSLYELSSEIAHSSPLLFYSNRDYFKSLAIVNLYDTFFRLENLLYCFLAKNPQIDSVSYFNMRKDYLPEMQRIISIERISFQHKYGQKK